MLTSPDFKPPIVSPVKAKQIADHKNDLPEPFDKALSFLQLFLPVTKQNPRSLKSTEAIW